uniref:Uncharacterized protein n=1 Tax=Chromera velia CCMP2878 TaxID=1169474 RepID=A0A0G4H6V5_9ALVE|eukprot:Cvel_24910.t1-p1 / transcript=Cvel_24910.t1 / gene=Cvel_24910 / organism=Chromera_velia_CCMP2878 / gene_product=hypothetical protein / transcript_product=hypothetical protein / location=Cvel_scaffold2755:20129-20446(-) / protein_length=106 / sequence_SO=supercontig / SO=protein_coding / is_pseudo=false
MGQSGSSFLVNVTFDDSSACSGGGGSDLTYTPMGSDFMVTFRDISGRAASYPITSPEAVTTQLGVLCFDDSVSSSPGDLDMRGDSIYVPANPFEGPTQMVINFPIM